MVYENEFIIKLIEQGNRPAKDFNYQDIANSLNALSKWDIKQFKGANEFIVKLLGQGNLIASEFDSQSIANSLNALSKWDINQFEGANEFIVKLIEQGSQPAKKFRSQEIANSLNALSKWDINQFEGANEFIVKLIEQGSQPAKKFRSQEIANSLNALSKWNIKQLKGANEFIVKLIEQGSQPAKEFNYQEISNSLNALSKWNIKQLKEAEKFIIKLIKQGDKQIESFNAQDIANSYDALYKFKIFDNKKWNDDQLRGIKNFIVKLAEEGKEVYREFNSQGAANTFNAFSKLDILDDSKWTSEEQSKLKFLIVNLAGVNEVYENYNLKAISKTYQALCKWDVFNGEGKFTSNKFRALIIRLKDRVYTIAEKQDLVEPDIDIRFASQIIKDLPELKSKNLIKSESELPIPLMQCLSISVNSSSTDSLKDNWAKKNILSGLQALYEIISKIEDGSDLEGVFDKDLSKIHNKLMKVKVSYANEVLEEISKLSELGIIKNGKLLDKCKRFTLESRVSNENCNKTCDEQISSSNLNYNAEKKNVDDQLLKELFTKDLSNQEIEARGVNSLQDNEMGSTDEGLMSVVSSRLSSLFNYMRGYFPQAIPPYGQTTDTKGSQSLKDVEDKIIEEVKQVILEMVGSEESNIDFKQMKKKIVQKIRKGNFDVISESIASRIFEEGTRNLKAKFKSVESCKQILDKRIGPIWKVETNLEPQSCLSNTSAESHLTQDKSKTGNFLTF